MNSAGCTSGSTLGLSLGIDIPTFVVHIGLLYSYVIKMYRNNKNKWHGKLCSSKYLILNRGREQFETVCCGQYMYYPQITIQVI